MELVIKAVKISLLNIASIFSLIYYGKIDYSETIQLYTIESAEKPSTVWDKKKTVDPFRSSISKAIFKFFFCSKCWYLVTKPCSGDKRFPKSTLIETFYLNVA